MLLGLIVAATCVARAQPSPRSGFRISGTVRDAASGHAPPRATVCAYSDTGTVRPRPRCGPVDSLGAFRIDSVAPGPRLLSVQCETIGLGGKQLTYDKVRVVDADLRRDWTVQSDGCDQRVVRHQKGVFRGHYMPGFEASAFDPCPANAWFLPSDSLGRETINRRAWVTWAANAVGSRSWPPAPRDAFGNPRYFVEWRGTVIGPGHYGHMGVSPFELRIDSVLSIRAASDADCR